MANETLKSILPQIGDDLKNGTYLRNYIEKNITQHKMMSGTKNASFSSSLCDGHAEEISIYDRKTDIDMKFVQDSITVIWKLIFLLIFVLVLLVFIIAFIISLWRKARRVAVVEENKRRRYSLNHRSSIPMENTQAHFYFPIFNGARMINFLKDLDPIYDYPCSSPSEYEKV